MAQKPIIAIDIDDVLGDEHSRILEFISREYNLDHRSSSIPKVGKHKPYWNELWGGEEVVEERYSAYIAAGHKYDHVPLPGAFEALLTLKRNYDLVIVTARGERHVDGTKRWLHRHFPSVFHDVIFQPLWKDGQGGTKAGIARELNADYLIDDTLDHTELAADAGIVGLLFGDYPWNHINELPQGIIRVPNWQAVEDYFQSHVD